MIAEHVYRFPNATDSDPGWLSPSQVTSYLRCPQCWYLERVEKIAKPLGISLIVGSTVHKAVEYARQDELTAIGRSGDGMVTTYAGDVAADFFDNEASTPADAETGAELILDLGSAYSSLGQAKDHALELAKFTVPRILELDRQRGSIAAVEFNLEVLPSPWPFGIHARVDCLYGATPETATMSSDLKTSKNQSKPDEYTALAQSMYEAFWSARGLPLKVAADVVSKGKHPDLQTYWMELDAGRRQRAYDTVMQVADAICRGDFPARPGWWCSFSHQWPEFSVTVNGFA